MVEQLAPQGRAQLNGRYIWIASQSKLFAYSGSFRHEFASSHFLSVKPASLLQELPRAKTASTEPQPAATSLFTVKRSSITHMNDLPMSGLLPRSLWGS